MIFWPLIGVALAGGFLAGIGTRFVIDYAELRAYRSIARGAALRARTPPQPAAEGAP